MMHKAATWEDLQSLSVATAGVYQCVQEAREEFVTVPVMIHHDPGAAGSGDNWFQTYYNIECFNEGALKELEEIFERYINDNNLHLYMQTQDDVMDDPNPDPSYVGYVNPKAKSPYQLQVYITIPEPNEN